MASIQQRDAFEDPVMALVTIPFVMMNNNRNKLIHNRVIVRF